MRGRMRRVNAQVLLFGLCLTLPIAGTASAQSSKSSRPSQPAAQSAKSSPAPAQTSRPAPATAPTARSTQPAPQPARPSQADRDRSALRSFPEVNRAVKGVSPIIDRAARNHAEASARKATGNSATVTSRDRPATSPIASPAHNRGAVDVVTPNMKRDASRISKQAGPGYTTIHEQPVRPKAGTGAVDRHTVYQGGNKVNSTQKPPRATGEHIHVQPEFNKRLHEAAASPKRSSSYSQATPQSSTRTGSKPSAQPTPKATQPPSKATPPKKSGGKR
jgi:hypothetical protein